MTRTYTIYQLLFPNGKSYVGQTIDFNRRMLRYKNLDCKTQRKLYKAINKYSWENIKINILVENLNKDNADLQEIYFIKELNCINNGYNLSTGGSKPSPSLETRELLRKTSLGRKHKPESIFKMKQKQKGRVVTVLQREKISKTLTGKYKKEDHPNFGKKHTEKHCKNQGLCKKGKITWMKGKTHTEASKMKNKESHIGKKSSELTRLKIKLNNRKRKIPLTELEILKINNRIKELENIKDGGLFRS